MVSADVASPRSQPAREPKRLALVVAHADDEGPVAPILARHAREGVRVYLIVASDGQLVAAGGVPTPSCLTFGP